MLCLRLVIACAHVSSHRIELQIIVLTVPISPWPFSHVTIGFVSATLIPEITSYNNDSRNECADSHRHCCRPALDQQSCLEQQRYWSGFDLRRWRQPIAEFLQACRISYLSCEIVSRCCVSFRIPGAHVHVPWPIPWDLVKQLVRERKG